jgi:hypothetical protein
MTSDKAAEEVHGWLDRIDSLRSADGRLTDTLLASAGRFPVVVTLTSTDGMTDEQAFFTKELDVSAAFGYARSYAKSNVSRRATEARAESYRYEGKDHTIATELATTADYLEAVEYYLQSLKESDVSLQY